MFNNSSCSYSFNFSITCRNFDHSEESDYKTYLETELGDYFVVEENGIIVGAGGINYVTNKNMACLSWDIISPSSQGKGIGRKLTEFRINYLNENPTIHNIIVRTSQLVYKFYEKLGFELESVEKDFWAKNYDMYQMKYNWQD